MADFAKVGGVRFQDGKMLDAAVGAGSVHSSATDGTTVGVTSAGTVEVKNSGISAAKMAMAAGRWFVGTLAASDAAAGILSDENTDSSNQWVVVRLLVAVETASSGACTANFGTASSAATSDNLLDGVNMAATGFYDTSRESNHGTNGNMAAKMPASGFLTGSRASGATSGMAGWYVAQLIEKPT